ncbi:MAG: hypothetical protein IJW40_08300 [Clostridia bacterium]|nr:hypothetical protein [Clostridia bacterium]
MLSKLIKYDFRALAKYGKPMLFVMLGVIVVGMLNAWGTGALIMYVTSQIEVDGFAALLMILSILLNVVIIFALCGALVAILILTLVHFYKSLVTDEGYLTFTLPVKASEILLSKIINGFLWQLIFGALAVFGVCAILAFGVGMSIFLPAAQAGELAALMQGFTEGLTELQGIFGELWGSSTAYTVIVWVLNLLVASVYGQLLYYTVIFFASVVTNKNKVLVSIGCICGAYFANGIVNSLLTLFSELFGYVISSNDASNFIGSTMTIMTLFYAGMSVLFFFLTKYMMEKKLNLP